MSWDSEDTIFRVVVNHEEQYSIWPDYLDMPDGWREVGVSGNKQHCLDHIKEVWTDMRPLSLRKHMAGLATTQAEVRATAGATITSTTATTATTTVASAAAGVERAKEP